MAYKIEFETGTAIPTLQNTFDSGLKRDLGGEEGEGKNELKLGGIGSTWRQLPTIKHYTLIPMFCQQNVYSLKNTVLESHII